MKNLKLLTILTIAFIAVAFFMSSCSSEVNYDKDLLTGKWQENTLFEVYAADGTGYTWDEGDDVTEEEAQIFEWELVGDELTQIHIMEMGGKIPKVYKITKLDDTTLSYEDDFGKEHIFNRVNK